MSRIIQTSERKNLIPQEEKPLSITQWKYVKTTLPEAYGSGLEICIGYDIFFIYNLSLPELNKINHKYMDVGFPYEYEYIRSGLICAKCGGTGIVDWIAKATPSKGDTQNIYLHNVIRYVRNKKGPVNIFHDFNSFKIYTSTPRKRMGENFCPSCYGCSIKLPSLTFEKTIVFDPS